MTEDDAEGSDDERERKTRYIPASDQLDHPLVEALVKADVSANHAADILIREIRLLQRTISMMATSDWRPPPLVLSPEETRRVLDAANPLQPVK